jgi:4-hydroxy-3-methylbut-2-enyl diphosphate reductase
MDETSDVIDAVREMAGLVDVMLVMGARNSSNSNRLH